MTTDVESVATVPPVVPAQRGGQKPGRRRRKRGSPLWTWLLLPGTMWMSCFFIGSLLLIIALSFGTRDLLGNPHFGLSLDSVRHLTDPAYLKVGIRSLVYAVLTALICLLVAYPVAYAIALYGGRFKNALIAAIVVPFFANYLVRMFGWSVLLADDGPVLRAARALGLPSSVHIINTNLGVIIGLVYGFVVFMILPLYAALERMDTSLIEAGRDLYGGPLRTFFFVTLPATRQGALAGLALVFLPATGDFVSAQLMGGPDQIMTGSQIDDAFTEATNQPLGSALTTALLLVLLITMIGYVRRAGRDDAEAVR